MAKKPPKSLDDFKAKHDPRTVISALTKQLQDVEKQLGLEAAIKDLLGTTTLSLDRIEAPAWTLKAAKASGSPGVPTLFLSDFHWWERVNKAEMNGVNEYDENIAVRRLRYTVETAVRLLTILSPVVDYPGIVVPLGGDMVTGWIHEELVATNAGPTIPAVLDLFENLAAALKLLADTFGNVLVPCVSGNHGRDTKKTWAKLRNKTSFDWLLYQILARHFAGDKRFTFYVPAGSDALYRVFNTRYLLTHGDQFKSGDSIIGPIGPIFRGRQKKLARNQAVNQDFDVMILGHWHQYIHTQTLIVNGSLKGYDEYAAQGNFGFEPAQQALWITHPDHGITYRMPVKSENSVKGGGVAAPWASVPTL